MAAAAVFLWKEVAVPPMVAVGYAETNIANVAAPLPGFVAQMTVKRFQQVKAGEPICQIIIKDPKILAAEEAIIEAQIQLIRIGMAPILQEAQTDLNYYKLRLDLLRERADQATARIDLLLKQEEFSTADKLHKDGIVSDIVWQRSKTQVDSLQTAIAERSNLLERVEANLKNFILPESVRNTLNPVQAAVDVQEAKLKELEATYGPRFLYAPIDGVVSMIHRHSGESVVAGDAIITVSSVQSEQIVAFVRQPLIYSPKIGMAVRVRARTPHRETGEANIIQVGSQMEAYSSAMLPFASTRPQEWGLPVMISLPAGLKVVPGELVDIVFQAKREQ